MTSTNDFPVGPLAEKLGIKLLSADANEVIGTMPVDGNTQPFGLLNGGAHLVLAETLGSIGANLAAGSGRFAVGLDINASHHKAIRNGIVTGTARALSIGKTIAAYEVKMTDESGALLSSARITCLLRDAAPNRSA